MGPYGLVESLETLETLETMEIIETIEIVEAGETVRKVDAGRCIPALPAFAPVRCLFWRPPAIRLDLPWLIVMAFCGCMCLRSVAGSAVSLRLACVWSTFDLRLAHV